MNLQDNYNLDAAKSYLHSAVFVDDNIFEDSSRTLPQDEEIVIVGRKPIFRRDGQPSAEALKAETENLAPAYHPRDIVSSFASEGIICALYEPAVGFSTDRQSEIFKICETPDIIILDWDFTGDQGKKALGLISTLIKQSTSEVPHYARLISVYTSDPSLVGVANAIADRLTKDSLDFNPVGCQYRMQAGSVRLIVLGKPISRFGAEEEEFTVPESQLATTLIQEFSAMNAGILPSMVLRGLAAIRRNSKRILDRFHGDLDGPFLLHRAMVSASEEAFNQLPEMLCDELRAIIDDEPLTAEQILGITIDNTTQKRLTAKDKALIKLADDGTKASKIVAKMKEEGGILDPHLRLASLFSCRTHYSGKTRVLSFGTIVRFRKKARQPWRFAVCLMPACDSVRLNPEEVVWFPFWTLLEEKVAGAPKGRRGFVIEDKKGLLISLAAGGAAGDMVWTDYFVVDQDSKTVLAKKSSIGFRYPGSKRQIEWVGQLKPLHAHRIAHDITENLSRVGVTEADWLRVLCSTPS